MAVTRLALIGAFLTMPLGAFLQQQQSELLESMPEGEGKSLVRTLCVGCHGLETTVLRKMSREQWRRSVNDMVYNRGAQIRPEQIEIIVGYLAEYYGPDSVRASALDHPGKVLLTSTCFSCHGGGMWRDLRQDRRGWQGVLYRMVGRGALWTEAQINDMADYLTESQAPIEAIEPQTRR